MSWQKAILLNLPLLVAVVLNLLPIDRGLHLTVNLILIVLGLLLVMGWQYRELLQLPGHGLLKGNGVVPLVFYGTILVFGLLGLRSLAAGGDIGGPIRPGAWGAVIVLLFLHSWLTYWLSAKLAGTSGKAGLVAFLVLLALSIQTVIADIARLRL